MFWHCLGLINCLVTFKLSFFLSSFGVIFLGCEFVILKRIYSMFCADVTPLLLIESQEHNTVCSFVIGLIFIIITIIDSMITIDRRAEHLENRIWNWPKLKKQKLYIAIKKSKKLLRSKKIASATDLEHIFINHNVIEPFN